MAMLPVPPVPTQSEYGSYQWTEFYYRLGRTTNLLAKGPYITANNLSDILAYPTWTTGFDGNLPLNVSPIKWYFNPKTGVQTGALRLTATALPVNYVDISGNDVGKSPTISPFGLDSDIDLTIKPKGNAAVAFPRAVKFDNSIPIRMMTIDGIYRDVMYVDVSDILNISMSSNSGSDIKLSTSGAGLVKVTNGLAVTTTITSTTSMTVGTAFGCNGKTAQTSVVSGGAVATTGATNVAPYGFTTAAQANDIITKLNLVLTALVANGIMS